MKQCKKCHEWKDESQFYVAKTAAYVFTEGRCKACKNRAKNRPVKNRPEKTGIKRCQCCHEFKALAEFHVAKQGRKTICRICIGKMEKRATDPMKDFDPMLQRFCLARPPIRMTDL